MNERIKQLAEQAQKVAYYTDGGYTPIMTLDQEKFAELIVREVVSKMEVEGSDFYYNKPNNYGAITVKFFVGGDAKQMTGEEIRSQYHGGIRGTGRYKLNDKFVEHLMNQHFGVKE
jgi:hypothetical protein